MQIDSKPRRRSGLTVITLLLIIKAVAGRPDVRESPFARNLQPPLLQQDESFNGGGSSGRAVDSYGNPIDALRPIDTPDGRKVVSAQGVQFEIPTYASGITEIRRPADDLLPPHIDSPQPENAVGASSTPSPVEANPFDSATIPAWLRDFDYPDVGPGVPFNPDNFGSGSGASSTRSPPTPPPTTISSFSHSSAFPSKVTLPLPGSSEEPPLVLVPPADHPEASPESGPPLLTNSVTPFAARLDPQSTIGSPNASPNSIGGEQFPPFGTAGGKVEYTKSDEGKVISTPVAGSNQRKPESATPPSSSSSNSGKYTGGFGAPPGLLKPHSASNSNAVSASSSQTDIYVAGNQHEFSQVSKANKARPTVNPGRYTGGFGAPTGVLSPQAEPRPFQHHSVQQPQHNLQAAATEQRREQSRFGGPPGILVPFDNVQRTGGQ
ncbi:uncharacterized protein Dana_GF11592, isoform D [Drosophila ananassae]|uniref:Uncharacterized protein, isoform D n=1 Tax=Drosophila ananassae TaxID=7217 RepID=A0A0P8Y4V3_DROAN|nr:proline-rich receptor-like protein kinase PERK9 isoform X4 [Drosophila ananassae]KPU76608.1 uncharacterized protein Dana_GF11592, isoform D [Drosophila ananassae]